MITVGQIQRLAKILKRDARKEINRQRYWRQYARRAPIERKVRFVGPAGPVVYNCPVTRWTRAQFLGMWPVRYIPPAQRRMDP